MCVYVTCVGTHPNVICSSVKLYFSPNNTLAQMRTRELIGAIYFPFRSPVFSDVTTCSNVYEHGLLEIWD